MESFEFDLDKALDELEKLDAEESEHNRQVELYNDESVIKDLLESLILRIESESALDCAKAEISAKDNENVKDEKNLEKSSVDDQNGSETNTTQKEQNSQLSQENSSAFAIEIIDYKSEWDQLSDSEKTLGLQAPVWLPDSEAENCLKCGLRFTFRKRRHHCRACGLIFCSSCCNEKLELAYKLNNNEAVKELTKNELSRVCVVCFRIINKVNELKEKINQIDKSIPIVSVLKKSKSTEQASSEHAVLDKTSSNRRKNVRFSDGLFPGQSTSLNENSNLKTVFDASDACFDEYKAISQILENNQDENVIFFKLMGNLRVNVALQEMNNCGKCWIYVTNGMCVNAQDELVFILKPVDSQFKQVPRQILYHIMDIYEKSSKGCRISYMNHMLYNYENEKLFAEILRHSCQTNFVCPNTLLENKNNSAFFYFRPTKMHLEMSLKKIEKLLPKEPYVIGYLIQKWEVPWAKLFPLRLMLRFGEQFESYPCPIVSDHDRKPVYGEIGHSIMSLLSDVRNFQYTIPQIDGINILLDGLNTSITIPESQYDLLMKSLLTSNDYVFSFASLQINEQVDSYLIAAENENLDSYSSKRVDFNSKGDQKTGVCFVVFNGAFKKNATQNAKQTVIEDGLMIHIDFDTMKNLKQALQSMQPFRIECSKVQSDHVIDIEWQSEDSYLSRNVSSIIDGRCLQGVKNLRLANSIDYKEPKGPKAMKWSQIYLIKADEETQIEESSFNLQKFIEIFSSGCCVALSPMLNKIADIYQSFASGKYFEPFRIGVRVEVNKDQVGYCLGMYGHLLNDSAILESLDNNLVQILHQVNATYVNLLLEFIFYIHDKPELTNKRK